MPLILGTNSIKDTGYNVANSCRFDGSSAYMTKTPGSAGSQVTQTYSVWVKRSKLGDEEFIMYARKDADDDTRLYFENDTLRFQCTVNNTTHTRLWTNRVFRDPSAWYHIVISYDSSVSTPSTSSVQMFINGVKETSFSATIYPSQNDVSYWCDDSLHTIGRRSDGTSNYYNGYMAEAVLIDGSALTASSFGEFDEDSPTIWKPKDVSGLTFGTNGFYLDFEASDNLGNDANGGTDFSESGLAATDQCVDSPTNNFATLNSLIDKGITYSEGNVHYKNTHGSNSEYTHPTIQNVSNGRWYYEIRMASGNNDSAYEYFGSPTAYVKTDDNIHPSGTTTVSSGDIFGFYLNYEDGQITIHRNGSEIYQSSSGISLSTTTAQIAAFNNTEYQANFGNPSYSISSGNADANGYGNFEYSPVLSSVNFYSLCTKNLAEYG
tara:strand:+ start:318 stop:1622 length:1305 start_codon:yes stop_codon:yes gene_type:complete